MNLLFERRVLIFMTWLAKVGIGFLLTSVSTDYWIIVIAFNEGIGNTTGLNSSSIAEIHGIPLNDTDNRVFLWSHSGLWKRCDVFLHSQHSVCQYHNDFMQENGLGDRDFLSAEVSCVVIVMILTFVATSFSIYSIIHPRYIFKRLSGFLHIMTTVALLAVIEMVKSEGHLAFHDFHKGILENSRIYYGYSYLLAWTVFIIHTLTGLAFLVLSKKAKIFQMRFSFKFKIKIIVQSIKIRTSNCETKSPPR